MKKSEKYKYAMLAVIESTQMDTRLKLEIIEALMADKSTAELVEKWEEEKNG